MILTVVTFMYCPLFLCEKILTLCLFFLAYFKRGSCCNLDHEKNEKEEVGMELKGMKKKKLRWNCF